MSLFDDFVDSEDVKNKPVKKTYDTIGCRYRRVYPRSLEYQKSKQTFNIDTIASRQLDEVYIKRLRECPKIADRTSLICEAISLLFEKEMNEKL